MNNIITVETRRFPVRIKDNTGECSNDIIVLSKQQLQAAQIVGQSSKELIHRLYKGTCFRVLDIGKAEKKTVCIDLGELWEYDATIATRRYNEGDINE